MKYTKCLPFYKTQIITPFPNSTSQPIMIKCKDFKPMDKSLWSCFSILESLTSGVRRESVDLELVSENQGKLNSKSLGGNNLSNKQERIIKSFCYCCFNFPISLLHFFPFSIFLMQLSLIIHILWFFSVLLII